MHTLHTYITNRQHLTASSFLPFLLNTPFICPQFPLFYVLYLSSKFHFQSSQEMDNGAAHTKDYLASPALSLSLAGVFRNAATVQEGEEDDQVEEGEEESGGGACRGEAVEMSSENTGPLGRSDEDEGLPEEGGEIGDDDSNGRKKRKRKRKKYHRHTAEQIREMEALFKESPHPDEKQRQQLSERLGLSARQVKFWFQNRRTQIKAIQERHENSLLKSEMDKLREENQSMRETIKKACCPNCGFAAATKDTTMTTEEQQLRIENARLKAEIEKLSGRAGHLPERSTSPSSAGPATATISRANNGGSLDFHRGCLGLDKPRIMEMADRAMEEVLKMATMGEPLWIRSVETGREILNYDEYIRMFSPDLSSDRQVVRPCIEASRETGSVFLDISRLVQAFMDVNQWKEMFPCMISKAGNVDVVSDGEGTSRNGSVQLMFAELQMLTPMVPTRELNFIRYCKQVNADRWAIADVSVAEIEENIDASLLRFRKRPSGCIIEDRASAHCKVIWVEHMECQKSRVPTMFRSMVSNSLAFGARHWMATLQQQCERMVFSMATNVPAKDSNGVTTLAGRRSILRLAQRMTSSFCHSVGAARHIAWTKTSTRSGDDIRFSCRKNISDPGEPIGVIVCAVLSTWLPVTSATLFDFLKDESQRTEWDLMLSGGPTQTIVNLAKGQDRGNSVTLLETKSTERNSMWILQDSYTNAYESMVVYTTVEIDGMQSVITGCDSNNMAILPSGFSILPDGLDSRPLIITSRSEEKTTADQGGSLLTLGFQIHANVLPSVKLTHESVEQITTIASCTLHNIRRSLQCEDG